MYIIIILNVMYITYLKLKMNFEGYLKEVTKALRIIKNPTPLGFSLPSFPFSVRRIGVLSSYRVIVLYGLQLVPSATILLRFAGSRDDRQAVVVGWRGSMASVVDLMGL